ncbi:hypothetical protein H5410_027501 [Solanum commersonii]|uniref:Uncharacterized protein n=1 Tax=Solanum commersonii TaxID=4109 RepID=A0A9J5YZD0_SOLCO|nr:hypothetical protein H5410_027501 [Solanum commersonii]
MLLPIGLPIVSNRELLQHTQDQKGLFKACNGARCKASFGLIIAVNSCFFDYEHYSSHQY